MLCFDLELSLVVGEDFDEELLEIEGGAGDCGCGCGGSTFFQIFFGMTFFL